MSCGKDFNTGSCVCDILAAIAAEQNDTVGDCCESSCERSLRELVGGVGSNGFNTIPVQLICTTRFEGQGSDPDTCGTVFGATGYRRRNATSLEYIRSTFFRVKSVDENGCAVLELLCGVDNPKGKTDCTPNPSDTIDVDDFERTGICITIDCTCFCGIVCLPALNIPRA